MKFPARPSNETIVVVQRLSVTYLPRGGQPVGALNQASIEIRRGELVGILGESGSGKSTLAEALLRLLPKDARYVSQSLRFREYDRAHVRMSRFNRRMRIEELLGEVGFDQPQAIYAAYPHQLSGGQRQRVVIAQAMACRPALVIGDEPTSKLDASLQAEILSLMREISRRHQTAFVLISHDPTVLAGFVDRIAVMYAGRIVEEGRTEDIFRRPLHPYTQALVRLCGRHLPARGDRTRFAAIDGEPPDVSHPAVGCPFAARCPERMQVCTERDLQETTPQPSHRVSCFKYDN